MSIFFELHKDIPREGPGSDESTRKAFSMLPIKEKRLEILDVGCGPGMQTLELSRIINGKIAAVDNHQPFLDVLEKRKANEASGYKISTMNMSMFNLEFEEKSFDLIWSEGAIFIIGFEKGLKEWKKYLTDGGCIAVTEISWLKPNPPEEVRKFWKEGYPGMGSAEENIKVIKGLGYRLLGSFVLPECDWWDNYYNYLQNRVELLRSKYEGNQEAMSLFEAESREMELYRKYSEYYGYVFYLMEK